MKYACIYHVYRQNKNACNKHRQLTLIYTFLVMKKYVLPKPNNTHTCIRFSGYIFYYEGACEYISKCSILSHYIHHTTALNLITGRSECWPFSLANIIKLILKVKGENTNQSVNYNTGFKKWIK